MATLGRWRWDRPVPVPHMGLGNPLLQGVLGLAGSGGPGVPSKPGVTHALQTEQSHVEEVRLRPVVSGARRRLPVTEGIVEVRYKDGWAQICDEGWDTKNSRVICGMMGFPAEKKVNRNFYK